MSKNGRCLLSKRNIIIIILIVVFVGICLIFSLNSKSKQDNIEKTTSKPEEQIESTNQETSIKKFSVSFLVNKYQKIKEIYDTGEYHVKTLGGDVIITKVDENGYTFSKVSLEDALQQKLINADDILKQAILDEKNGVCTSFTYEDGGSKEYYYDDYTILKLNTLTRDKDIIIGTNGKILYKYNIMANSPDYYMEKKKYK